MPSLTPPTNPQVAPASPSGANPLQPQAVDPLANLRDIQLPGEVSSLPAFGAWLLAGAILLLLFALGYYLWRRYQRRHYRRAALQVHSEILDSNGSDTEKLQSLNALLKRVALYAYPQTTVAGLYGAQWQALLQAACPQIPIDEKLTRTLTEQLYSAEITSADELEQFADYVKAWINRHDALKAYPEGKLAAASVNTASTTTKAPITQGDQHAHV